MLGNTYREWSGGIIVIFLFEDKEDDQLSCLWRKSFYNNDIRLVYANGNGRLVEKAEELLKENDTT